MTPPSARRRLAAVVVILTLCAALVGMNAPARGDGADPLAERGWV